MTRDERMILLAEGSRLAMVEQDFRRAEEIGREVRQDAVSVGDIEFATVALSLVVDSLLHLGRPAEALRASSELIAEAFDRTAVEQYADAAWSLHEFAVADDALWAVISCTPGDDPQAFSSAYGGICGLSRVGHEEPPIPHDRPSARLPESVSVPERLRKSFGDSRDRADLALAVGNALPHNGRPGLALKHLREVCTRVCNSGDRRGVAICIAGADRVLRAWSPGTDRRDLSEELLSMLSNPFTYLIAAQANADAGRRNEANELLSTARAVATEIADQALKTAFCSWLERGPREVHRSSRASSVDWVDPSLEWAWCVSGREK